MATILAVDDHALFRLGVSTALQNAGKGYVVVGSVGSVRECYEFLETHEPPDLLLLDIILPDGSGEDIARHVRKEYPEVRILVLSAESSDEVLLNLVEAEVHGFVAKDELLDELLEGVEYILSGERFFGKKTDELLKELYSDRCRRERAHAEALFSDREREVIKFCCEGFPTKVISDKLGISPRTVDAHKANIFSKLGISNTVELVRYALKHRLVKLG